LGVTANTVARWERGEIPVPSLIALLLRERDAANERNEEVHALQVKIDALSYQVKSLKVELRIAREQRRTPNLGNAFERIMDGLGRGGNTTDAAPDKLFRSLAQKYHPDRNTDPRAAEFMSDLNQLWSAMRRR